MPLIFNTKFNLNNLLNTNLLLFQLKGMNGAQVFLIFLIIQGVLKAEAEDL